MTTAYVLRLAWLNQKKKKSTNKTSIENKFSQNTINKAFFIKDMQIVLTHQQINIPGLEQ